MKKIPKVIIIGGSIAGLIAARVLSHFADQVIIYERDNLAGERKGVPQSHQLHVLLKSGLDTIEKHLPGFKKKLLDNGAVSTSATMDWASMFPEGWLHRFESDLKFVCASRPFIENQLREQVLEQSSNIILKPGYRWLDLKASSSDSPVVTLQNKLNGETIHEVADLVIDASGNHTKLPTYLKQANFTEPTETVVSSFLGYSSRIYKNIKIPENYKGVLITPKAQTFPIGGAIIPLENNQFLVGLYGFAGHYPPVDEQEFESCFHNVRSKMIAEAMKNAEPLSKINAFRKDTNTLRKYGTGKWPKGIIAVGDSVCSPNPYYGQGMTGAAFSADELAKALINYTDNSQWAQQAQKKIVKRYLQPWFSNAIEDLRWDKTSGMQRNIFTKFLNKVVDRLLTAALTNPVATYAFVGSLHLTLAPKDLLKPSVIWAILKKS